jgi:glutamate 5-kinase
MYRRLIVKLGTSTLTAGTERIVPPRLLELARQVAELRARALELVLVTSGAIAAGREALNHPQLPKNIPAKQMLAAVGQPRLMALYEQIFRLHGLTLAQVLLDRADFADRRRYLNSRNAFAALLAQGVVPIVNENDTVATDEIRVGDNDNLSALVANLIDADLLILLTDQRGLFTADPRTNPGAQLVPQVDTPDIPEALWLGAGGSGTGQGTGGMVTKLQAADLARRSGTTVVIAQGTAIDVLIRVTMGERLGTWFLPVTSALEARKRYILSGTSASGVVVIDPGAVAALQRGSSLLPIGVTGIEGDFDRGDMVRVMQPGAAREIARGIANYAAADVLRIHRKHSEEIERILGYDYGEEVIHRNDLVLL